MLTMKIRQHVLLPDVFGVTVKMENGHKLDFVSNVLQVINGIVQIPLSFLIKVDQSGGSCYENSKLLRNIQRF